MIETTLEPTDEDVKAAMIWLDENNQKYDDIALVARTECANRQLREAQTLIERLRAENKSCHVMIGQFMDTARGAEADLATANQRTDKAFNEGVEAAAKVHDDAGYRYLRIGSMADAARHSQWALNLRRVKRDIEGDQA